MADPNLEDFYGRVGRIHSQHQTGVGFIAAGTIGRSVPRRQRRSLDAAIGPAIVLFALIILMKATIHFTVGGSTYDQRVKALARGDATSRLAAFFVQADPATLAVSHALRDALR